MKGCLSVIRWILGIINTLFLIILIFIAIFISSLTISLINRENIKSWIKVSMIYPNVKNIALGILQNSGSEKEIDESMATESSPSFLEEMVTRLKNPNDDFTKLIDKIATPEFLEKSVVTIIDATYDWLEGKKDKIDFSINLVENKADLVELLSVTFKEKVKALPKCSSKFVVSKDFNPLETECWPINLDYTDVNRFINENIEREEFKTLFNSTKISSDSIIIPIETSKNIQSIYNIVRFTPLILLVLLIVLSGITILIIPSRKSGLVILGITLILSSLFWLVIRLTEIISIATIVSRIPIEMKSPQFEILSPYLLPMLQGVFNSFWSVVLIFSILFVVLGVLMFLLAYLHKSTKIEEQTKT